jgi:hypothetical protein
MVSVFRAVASCACCACEVVSLDMACVSLAVAEESAGSGVGGGTDIGD